MIKKKIVQFIKKSLVFQGVITFSPTCFAFLILVREKKKRMDLHLTLLMVVSLFGLSNGLMCGKQGADIVFVLDSSFSIWRVHFQEQLRFVVNVVDQFPVGKNQGDFHIAVITYSENVTVQFHLKDFIDKEQLKRAVMRIKRPVEGGTYTFRALKYARQRMFITRSGGRTYSDKIIIVITDGLSQNTTATRLEATRAHYEGIQVFAIGVGGGVDKQELELIASEPSRNHVFTVDNYNFLDTIKRKVARETCRVPKNHRNSDRRSDVDPSVAYTDPPKKRMTEDRPMRSPPALFPKRRLDIMFLTDDCQFGRQNLQLVKQFIVTVIREMHVAPYWTRVGVFSSQCSQQHNDIYLTEHRTSQSFIEDFNKPDSHNIVWQLRRLRHHGFNVNNGGRDDVPHIAVTFINDKLQKSEHTIREANRARYKKIKLFVVAVGKNYSPQEIRQLADRDFYIQVRNFESLRRHTRNFLDTLLKGL